MKVTTKRFLKTEQAEIEMTLSRLECMGKREGNPMGCEIKRFGKTVAFAVKNIPGPSYNTVKGFNSSDLDALDDILGFYREKGITPRFELTPADSGRELCFALHRKGFLQTGFHTSLEGRVERSVPSRPANNVEVRSLDKEEFDLYGQFYAEAFGMPPFTVDGITANNRALADEAGWYFYLATAGGAPAGIASLYITGDTGVLAAAGTLPAYRQKGVHTALIDARRAEAEKSGCRVLTGQASFGSGSHRNMLKAGLQTLYTKAVWESADK
ncbi:GNAT family N-acetyltransferase [Alteribacter natronophilus]|uniref:GNAT family N-acetyltransferase n=1 Tax=Alteribacter natronophilus TaxID=2583810 RepID=UPI00110F57F2|nr:GNAT family N-acetyltransferase [Alteribacter natronophilus]TMW70726.1 GNAT family N-acetyltransferase [Alteribacter natronophilus]